MLITQIRATRVGFKHFAMKELLASSTLLQFYMAWNFHPQGENGAGRTWDEIADSYDGELGLDETLMGIKLLRRWLVRKAEVSPMGAKHKQYDKLMDYFRRVLYARFAHNGGIHRTRCKHLQVAFRTL